MIEAISGLLIGFAVVLRVWSTILLRRAGISETWQLAGTYTPEFWVREGPYALMRHPIYVSTALLTFAIALLLFRDGLIAVFMTWIMSSRDIGRAAAENALRKAQNQHYGRAL